MHHMHFADKYPPHVIDAVSNELYVDDCLVSVSDEDTAVRIQGQLLRCPDIPNGIRPNE